MRKISIKEIEERITNLKSNLNLVRDENARNRIHTEINTLVEFKDKNEGEILSAISETRSERNITLKWMVGILK